MAKKDSQAHAESHTDIHIETDTQSNASAGADPFDQTPPADDRVTELTADLQRLQAEFANYKRRAEADRADILDFAKARLVREFLTVRDSFDAEAAHRPAGLDPAWAASIDSIRTQFDQVLTTLGVERFTSLGQPFDPHLHEAIATDGDGDIVTKELQPGYKLGPTVLRPAMVEVGSQPAAK